MTGEEEHPASCSRIGCEGSVEILVEIFWQALVFWATTSSMNRRLDEPLHQDGRLRDVEIILISVDRRSEKNDGR